MDGLPVEPDLPGIRTVESIEDFHEGALSRAVLPQESMDSPAVNIQVHLIIGFHCPEGLADSSQGKEGRRVHLGVIAHGKKRVITLSMINEAIY
jgi:hypothetical protein